MVSVITINYNLSVHTIECVDSVLDSDYNELMVFLVDNGSEDGDYRALARHYNDNRRVRLLRIEKNCGYVKGINHGITEASRINPDYFLILNNDTLIDKPAISFLVDAAVRHENKAIVSGKVLYYDQPDIIQHTGVIFSDRRYFLTTYPGRNEKDTGQCDTETERDSLDDVFWLLPAQVVKETGLYCEQFFLYAEQGDYALRAAGKGFKLIYTPKARIWHKESLTAGKDKLQSPAVQFLRAQGRYVFQHRNMKGKYFYPHVFSNVVRYMGRILFFGGRKRRLAIANLRGYLSGMRLMMLGKSNDGFNPYASTKNRGEKK